SGGAVGQMNQPAPAPELKKLEYFSGNWSGEATIRPGPWGPGGKFTDSVDGEWMKGGFFLVNHSDYSLPPELGGTGTSLAVIGYDPDNKVYTQERFDSTGHHVVLKGTLAGDTLTWTAEDTYQGTAIKSRFIIKMISPAAYTSKYEVSSDGGATWLPFWEGKSTKK
ncbi:MAG: DUF1579 family protein, partial [Acidobacteria bacterium]|nr:DUF1579 family protein [Acidobacteriota bacterium]